MLKLLHFYLFSFFVVGFLWAGMTERVEVLQISSSKKTMIIDKGHLRGIRVGDKATFILFSDSTEPLLQFGAYGEAIKVHTNYSFWYLSEIRNKPLLVKGERLQLLSHETSNAGIRPHKIKQEKGVIVEGETKGMYIRSQEEGIPPDKVRFQGKDRAGRKLVETIPLQNQDIETLEISKWNKGGKKKFDDYADEIEIRHLKEQSLTDSSGIRESENVDNLKSLTQGLTSRSQKDPDWLDRLHRKQSNRVSYTNAYKESKQKQHEGIQLWAVNKIKRDGAFWSADMSDEELRHFFRESGIAEERAKQSFVLGSFLKHELQLGYGIGVVQNTIETDLTNQGQGYSLNLGYEFNLGRTSPSLELFSIDIGASVGRSFFDSGTQNALAEQIDYGAMLNFYFYNKPSSLNKYIWFAGVGIKGGSANLSLAGGTAYSYQRHFMPTAKLGMKYRFFIGEMLGDTLGLGVSFFINYEYMRFSSLEDVSTSNLSEVIQLADFKATASLSVYF